MKPYLAAALSPFALFATMAHASSPISLPEGPFAKNCTVEITQLHQPTGDPLVNCRFDYEANFSLSSEEGQPKAVSMQKLLAQFKLIGRSEAIECAKARPVNLEDVADFWIIPTRSALAKNPDQVFDSLKLGAAVLGKSGACRTCSPQSNANQNTSLESPIASLQLGGAVNKKLFVSISATCENKN